MEVLSEEEAKCVLDSDAFYTIIGRRYSGKSTLICHLVRLFKRKLERGVVLCASPEAYLHYGFLLPWPYIHDEPNEKMLQRIYNYGHYEGLFVIAEDWPSSRKLMKSRVASRCLCSLFQHQFGWETGRNTRTEINEWLKHLHLDNFLLYDVQKLIAEYLVQGSALVVYSAQYPMDIPKNIRTRSQWFIVSSQFAAGRCPNLIDWRP